MSKKKDHPLVYAGGFVILFGIILMFIFFAVSPSAAPFCIIFYFIGICLMFSGKVADERKKSTYSPSYQPTFPRRPTSSPHTTLLNTLQTPTLGKTPPYYDQFCVNCGALIRGGARCKNCG